MSETKKKLQDVVPFGLMADAVDHLFQTREPQYYKDATLMEQQPAIFALILKSMQDADASFVDKFNMDEPELEEMWMSTGANGTFISHFTYFVQDRQDTAPSKKSVFLAGKFGLNADQMIDRVIPFYYLQGSYETPDNTNGQEVFFPLETGCRSHLKGQKEDCFIYAKDPNEFVQMLCYGRKAFEMILTGKTMSVSSLKDWLDEDKLEEADEEYAKMLSTSPDEFSQMIAWEKTLLTFGGSASFVGLTTPALN
jgi:hypothetical protein